MKAIGTIVCCLSCRTVVWAYDADYGDVRGICNIFNLPCPRCGERGNFDGWSISTGNVEFKATRDAWSAMRKIAKDNLYGYEFLWEPSGDNTWSLDKWLENVLRGKERKEDK